MNFSQKTIWITGASSGIGKQLALDLAKKNCKLILSSRKEDQLNKIKLECQNFTSDVAVLPLDLEDFEHLKSKAEKAIAFFGRIDVLINNGGISQRSLILDTDISVDQKLMNVDYLGQIALTKALLPHFIQNQSGTFVVVSSVMGKFGSPYRSGYCAAKHALHGFFDVLRMEHQKDNVNVTIICPGFVNTNVTRNAVTGDGSIYNHQDKKTEDGLDVQNFSRRMIRAIEKEKFEAYIGGKEAKAVYLKRFFPKLLHKVILKSQVR